MPYVLGEWAWSKLASLANTATRAHFIGSDHLWNIIKRVAQLRGTGTKSVSTGEVLNQLIQENIKSIKATDSILLLEKTYYMLLPESRLLLENYIAKDAENAKEAFNWTTLTNKVCVLEFCVRILWY